MSTLPKPHLTPEEYLEIERRAEFKSEYFRGEMFAMAGATAVHVLIVANATFQLMRQFQSRDCRVYPNDLRVCVSKAGLYTYPDVVAVCGGGEFLDGQLDTLLNPHLIVEVLSPTTEGYDRGRKFEYYRSIESLREYLMVWSDRVHAELFTREPYGIWRLREANLPGDTLDLRSVGCTLKLADLYDKVEW